MRMLRTYRGTASVRAFGRMIVNLPLATNAHVIAFADIVTVYVASDQAAL
jgi:hypothetical protein